MKGTEYAVAWTVEESGWGVVDTEAVVTAVVGGTTTHVVSGIAEGAPLRVKVRMKFDSTASFDANQIATDWTLVQVAEAAEAPSTPTIDTVVFFDLSPGETAFADLLLRFKGANDLPLSYNGGSPATGIVDYSPPPYSSSQSVGGAAFKLDGEPVQLGVISRVPIDTKFDVALQLQSTRLSGLEGSVETMKSAVSQPMAIIIEKPRQVGMAPSEVTAEFHSVAQGGDVYSATLRWDAVTIEIGNAPITSYTVSARTPTVASVACSSTVPTSWVSTSATSSALCIQAAPSSAVYTTTQVSQGTGTSFTITRLEVGRAACFAVRANNRVGSGAISPKEICIDVANYLQFKCLPGSAWEDFKACVACSLGNFSKSSGDACTMCDDGTYTPNLGATTCLLCNAGEYLPKATGITCDNCAIGMFSELAGDPCMLCATGKYTPQPGATTCLECPKGDFLSTPTSTQCTACARGRYADPTVGGSTTCELCDETGQYTPSVGATECSTCGDNTYATKRCPLKPLDQNCTLPYTECENCPTSRLLTCTKGEVELAEGAWYGAGEWAQRDAAFGQSARMFWVEKPVSLSSSTEMHACFNRVSCIRHGDATIRGANSQVRGANSQVMCRSDQGYYGPLCGACNMEEDFIRNGYTCEKCRDAKDNYLIASALIVAILVIVTYTAAWRSTRQHAGEYGAIFRRIAFSYVQMVGVLGIFKARGTAVFNEAIGKTSQIAGGSLTSMLAIKCILRTQVYGSFLINMMAPPIVAVLIGIVLIPTTLVKRKQEAFQRRADLDMRLRKQARVLADEHIDFVAPTHEPVFNLGNRCCKVSRKLTVLRCCRRPATNEYIDNIRRQAEGKRSFAPFYRPRLSFAEETCAGIPYAVAMSVLSCRVETTLAERRAWRAKEAVRLQRQNFKPDRRFVSVMVLVMYALYPTLVASTAMIFSCSQEIDGKRFLMADLTVTCFEGWHNVYLVGACVTTLVYCVGTPLIFALIIIFEMCRCHAPKCHTMKDEEAVAALARSGDSTAPRRTGWRRYCCRCTCICRSRGSVPWGYSTESVRCVLACTPPHPVRERAVA